jgi:hypothetical protein
MTAEQTLAELTTRDVLLQVDRRLTLIESDQRALDTKFEAFELRMNNKFEAFELRMNNKFEAFELRMNNKFEAFELRMNDKIDTLDVRLSGRIDGKVEGLRLEMNNRFQWTIGLLLASWVSIMAAVLLK